MQRWIIEDQARGVVLEQGTVAEFGCEFGLLVRTGTRITIGGYHVIIAR